MLLRKYSKKSVLYGMLAVLILSMAGCGNSNVSAEQNSEGILASSSADMEEELQETDLREAESEIESDIVSESESEEPDIEGLDMEEIDTEEVDSEELSGDSAEVEEIQYPQDDNVGDHDPYYTHQKQYGIWVSATKTSPTIFDNVIDIPGITYVSLISSEWSNLNPERFYVLSAGFYLTRESAEKNLPYIKEYYPDAYIKYTGEYTRPTITFDEFVKTMDKEASYKLTVSSKERVKKDGKRYILSGHLDAVSDGTVDLIFDENTIIASECYTLPHYEPGDTAMEWLDQSYEYMLEDDPRCGSDILGVYEVRLDGNHVKSIHGTYWWD